MDFFFRALVVLTVVLAMALWSMPYFDYMWLSYDQVFLLNQGGLGSQVPANELLHWGELALWIAISIGLFFYIKPARTAFVVLYAISIILSLFSGVLVLSPYESAISSIIGLADGAILTLAYLSSVAGKFEKSS